MEIFEGARLVWEMGAPVGTHCCSTDCDYDSRHDDLPVAAWTLRSHGWDLYYCDNCYRRVMNGGRG